MKIKSTSIDILWNGISLHQAFQEMILPPNISRNDSPTFINVTYKLQSISHQHCISIPSIRILCYDRKVRTYHFFWCIFHKMTSLSKRSKKWHFHCWGFINTTNKFVSPQIITFPTRYSITWDLGVGTVMRKGMNLSIPFMKLGFSSLQICLARMVLKTHQIQPICQGSNNKQD